MGPFEVSYLASPVILLHRGVTIGVVYAGNNVITTLKQSGPMTDLNGAWMVQSRHNFDNDSTRPVLYLQLVSPVEISSQST